MKNSDLNKLRNIGIIPVLRAPSPDDGLRVAEALLEAGFGTVEVTFTVPDAPRVIEILRTRHPDLLVGAGTVLSAEAARTAADAGARYLVSVGVVSDMIGEARRRGLPAFAGVFTPTEAVQALTLGADVLKLFPASTGGPAHLAALRGPLPDAVWCPTGGVDLDNIEAWVRAGAALVGVGGPLLQDAVGTGDMAGLQRRARQFLLAWRRAVAGRAVSK